MIESIVRTCSPTLHITPGPGHPLIFNDNVGDDDDADGDGDWDSDDNGDGDGDEDGDGDSDGDGCMRKRMGKC